MSREIFQEAKLEWNRMYANLIMGKRNWQIVAFLELVVVVILSSGMVYCAQKSKVVPYVVEVDQLGRAAYAGEAQEYKVTDERIIQAFLYRYIDHARSVVTDTEAMKKKYNEVYEATIRDVQTNFLNEYYRDHDPYEVAKEHSIQVEPASFLKQGENSYLIEWKEIYRDLENKRVKLERWQGLVSIVQLDQDQIKTVQNHVMNPFGIYVTGLSWSRIN